MKHKKILNRCHFHTCLSNLKQEPIKQLSYLIWNLKSIALSFKVLSKSKFKISSKILNRFRSRLTSSLPKSLIQIFYGLQQIECAIMIIMCRSFKEGYSSRISSMPFFLTASFLLDVSSLLCSIDQSKIL